MGTHGSASLVGASRPREADVLRLAVDIARQVVADEPFAHDLVRRIEVVLGADGGAGLTSFGPNVQTLGAPAVVASEGCIMPLGQAELAAQYAATHPTLGAMRHVGTSRPIRTSDQVRMEQFRETPEFAAMHGWMPAARFPAAIALHVSESDFVFVGLHRDGRDFTDDDLDALALIQHIVAPALTLNARLNEATSRLRRLRPDGAASIDDHLTTLTRREQQVLILASHGLTSGAIAHRLGLSERTVRKHLSAVYAKTGLRGRAAATAWWAGQGARRDHAATALARGVVSDT